MSLEKPQSKFSFLHAFFRKTESQFVGQLRDILYGKLKVQLFSLGSLNLVNKTFCWVFVPCNSLNTLHLNHSEVIGNRTFNFSRKF